MIALLVMTDGRRECIVPTLESSIALDPFEAVSELYIHDDSGDPEYRRFLEEIAPAEHGWQIIGPPAGRSGFGGAIRSAWAHLREHSSAEFVFHLEDDFTFRRPVPLLDMAAVLIDHPHLVQLALRRQPWNDHERMAGGIVEQHPAEYDDRRDDFGREWLEHRLFFTTNPSLYRRELVEVTDWPTGPRSEGRYSISLLGDENARFGFYGARDSGEWVEHIGTERVGTGY